MKTVQALCRQAYNLLEQSRSSDSSAAGLCQEALGLYLEAAEIAPPGVVEPHIGAAFTLAACGLWDEAQGILNHAKNACPASLALIKTEQYLKREVSKWAGSNLRPDLSKLTTLQNQSDQKKERLQNEVEAELDALLAILLSES